MLFLSTFFLFISCLVVHLHNSSTVNLEYVDPNKIQGEFHVRQSQILEFHFTIIESNSQNSKKQMVGYVNNKHNSSGLKSKGSLRVNSNDRKSSLRDSASPFPKGVVGT